MILHEVNLENFMPYFGKQDVDLRTSKAKPIILVKGENNRGKSSLFAAIRWALYGRVYDRGSQLVKDSALLNDFAWGQDVDTFSVNLVLEHDGHEYTINRSCKVSKDATGAKGGSKQKVFLQKNSTFVDHEEIDTVINEILDERISIFFLCDNEQLANYENLVKDDTAAFIEIKEAIENILGVPALLAVRDSLRQISADAFKEIRKSEDSNEEASKIEKDMAAQTQINNKSRAELAQAERKFQDSKREKDKINNLLQGFEAAAALIGTEKELIRETESSLIEIANLREDIQQAVKESWWFPISKIVESKIEETQSQTSLAATRQSELSEKAQKLSSLKTSSESGICAECNQPLPDPIHERHLISIGILEKEIEELSKPLIPSLESLLDESKKLSRFRTPSKASVLQVSERRLRILLSEARKRGQRLEEISKELASVDKDEVQQLNIKRSAIEKELGVIGLVIKLEQAKISESENEMVRLQTAYSRVQRQGDVSEISVEHAVSSHLSSVFERAVQGFRESTKMEVERTASEIFSNLVSDNAFSRLRINENYGLRLVDDEGQTFDYRSAGIEQIVALSLIFALGRKAVRSGSLVLDTPFARLDEIHRQKICNWLPKECEQVVLLIQSGENSSNLIEESLGDHISKEYSIVMGENKKISYIR